MSETKTALHRLHEGVDTLIKKHGTEKSATMIEALVLQDGRSKLYSNNITIKNFIEKKVISEFKIIRKDFFSSVSDNCKYARKSLFYLLSVHCNMSSAAIRGQYPLYQKTRNNISGQIKEIKELMLFPKANKFVSEKIAIIEKEIINFKNNL